MVNEMFSRLIWGICLLFLSAESNAQYAVESPLPVVTEGTLDNGLRYTLVPLINQQGRIDIRLAVEVGSVDESDYESGVAHIVEHMTFRASEAFPQGVAAELHRAGWVRAQNYNAVTNYERTQYMMSPPAGRRELDFALKALGQIAGYARFTDADLADERKIVLEEWRGKLGVADRMNQQRVRAIRYGSRYPLRPVMGREESISRTPAHVLRAFYKRWYRPANMRLMIIGDIDTADTLQTVRRYFSVLPAQPVPSRDYYESRLASQLRVVRLQDSQSGSSQLSYVFRFDDQSAKAANQVGMRHRLLDQITLAVLTRQLRRQSEELPSQISSLVVRKSDIGKTTVALGLFADVTPDGHQESLPILLREIERLKRYPLSERDIVTVKANIRESAHRMAGQPERREFTDWVQQLVTSWLQGRRYEGTERVGREANAILNTITVQDVNRHLQRWLSSSDTLVQYSIPGDAPFSLPTPDEIRQLQRQVASLTLAPPPLQRARIIPELPATVKSGSRVDAVFFAKQGVEQWRLSNGDRVVWLRTPLAQRRMYLTVVSPAGFMAEGLNPWQAQLAAQIVAESGPSDWRGEELRSWKQEHSLSMNVEEQADELQFTGQAPLERVEALFQLYHAYNLTPGIDPLVMKGSIVQLMRLRANSPDSVEERRQREIARLRFGGPTYAKPDPLQLKTLLAQTLLEQWQRMTSAPVTYYLLADMPESQLLPLVERYLASVPRLPASAVISPSALPGRRVTISAIGIEPRGELRVWSYSPQEWSPQSAVQVNIASRLANKYLKASLRDEAKGIYRIRIDSKLEDKEQRIATEVSFTSAPERGKTLWRQAEHVFAELPRLITPQDIEEQRQLFIRSERIRQNDVFTQLRRLIISYRHYGDPRYLSNAMHLADAITPNGVYTMAGRLLNPNNMVLYVTLPRNERK